MVCTVLSRVVRDLTHASPQFSTSCSIRLLQHQLLLTPVGKNCAKCLEDGEGLHSLLLCVGDAESPRAAETSLGLRSKKEK